MNMLRRIYRHVWRLIALFLVNKLFAGTNPNFFRFKRCLLQSIGFTIGKNTKIVGPVSCTGKLTIGTNCWIGANLVIRGNGCVNIGDNVDVGPDVTFLTGTHEIGLWKRRAGKGYNCVQSIGNGCWIGAKSVFVNNISVGDSSVVAATACVCKITPPNVLIGGVPAKIIKKLE